MVQPKTKRSKETLKLRFQWNRYQYRYHGCRKASKRLDKISRKLKRSYPTDPDVQQFFNSFELQPDKRKERFIGLLIGASNQSPGDISQTIQTIKEARRDYPNDRDVIFATREAYYTLEVSDQNLSCMAGMMVAPIILGVLLYLYSLNFLLIPFLGLLSLAIFCFLASQHLEKKFVFTGKESLCSRSISCITYSILLLPSLLIVLPVYIFWGMGTVIKYLFS